MHVVGTVQPENRVPGQAREQERVALVQPVAEGRRPVEAKGTASSHQEDGQGIHQARPRVQPVDGLRDERSRTAVLFCRTDLRAGRTRRIP